jgi:hypothetical protein
MKLKILFCFLILAPLCSADSLVSNADAIAAYGADGAYLVTATKELLRWNSVSVKWDVIAIINGNNIRQFDSLSDGTRVVGTDTASKARQWNLLIHPASNWSSIRPGETYDWVRIDPITNESMGIPTSMPGWETWDPQTPVSWDDYLPAGAPAAQKMKKMIVVDRANGVLHRWERDDIGQLVPLNRSGEASPFNIYYFGDDASAALSRMTAPPLATHNIDDVNVKQISYDELEQNLWGIDSDGRPWQWDNTEQQWILRNVRGPGLEEEEHPLAILLRRLDDYYVQTVYIDGVLTPLIIVYTDTKIMHLVVGELSLGDGSAFDYVILGSPPAPERFHNILLRPKETPQKIVRDVDGQKRIRENHYLERLLINNNIVASAAAISVYPAEHRFIRR